MSPSSLTNNTVFRFSLRLIQWYCVCVLDFMCLCVCDVPMLLCRHTHPFFFYSSVYNARNKYNTVTTTLFTGAIIWRNQVKK